MNIRADGCTCKIANVYVRLSILNVITCIGCIHLYWLHTENVAGEGVILLCVLSSGNISGIIVCVHVCQFSFIELYHRYGSFAFLHLGKFEITDRYMLYM